MISRISMILPGLLLQMLFSVCGEAVAQYGEAPQERVEIRLSEVGETTVPKTWGRFYNYDVQIVNNLPHSIFLLRMENLKAVSDYIKERNPQAMCYHVESVSSEKAWSDAMHGLQVIYGKGDVTFELKSKQSISFRIPVRLDDDAFKGAHKMRVAVKVSEKAGDTPKVKVPSNALPFPPK
jgi:hypothetical protein